MQYEIIDEKHDEPAPDNDKSSELSKKCKDLYKDIDKPKTKVFKKFLEPTLPSHQVKRLIDVAQEIEQKNK